MKKAVPLIILLLITFFVVWGFWNSQLGPVSQDVTENKVFVIQKGESVNSIVKRLEEEKLIKSATIFKIFLKLQKEAPHIEAGDFKLSPSQSVSEIVTTLGKGSLDKWVTILEGWRVEEVARKLNQELGIEEKEFLKHAKEGYMFPDTYLFNKNVAPSDIASILENTFEQKYTHGLQNKIKANGLTPAEGVILASIVEREARSDKVRTMVASILLKRFKIDMGLNADATIQYILGYQKNEKGWWKKTLTHDDLKVKSLYNTYLHVGLPPTPIANPSLSSLNAVANADAKTPYLYYYHDSKGNSYYGKTLDEHNANVANHPL